MSTVNRVLVVDDDLASRRYLEVGLKRRGYSVTAAVDAEDAQTQLVKGPVNSFDCVVTDYRMPGRNGLDLIGWIHKQDPNLAAIIVTAEGDRGLIAESLREGVIDFLDKPIDLDRLQQAVDRARERTQRQRRLLESETAVIELGRAQKQMLRGNDPQSPATVEVFFHPKYEAGGDFFGRFRPQPKKFLYLLTDVSGHDLQAAYISAYFQGVTRGMLEHLSPVGTIFAAFNRFLTEEWNRDDSSNASLVGAGASVGACAVALDYERDVASVSTHGMPAPVYWLADGTAQIVGGTGGFPLGWFSSFTPSQVTQSIGGRGSFCLWTDGLEDVAAKKGVTELSLAWAWHEARKEKRVHPDIENAMDDVLLAEIHLAGEEEHPGAYRPLILKEYHGGQTGEIDQLQAFWQRSLKMALSGLPADTLHDVLLASREAVLNALKHGCEGDPAKVAQYQLAYSPASRSLRARVSDPGKGHNFDVNLHRTGAVDDLLENHRGLVLLENLVTRLSSQRQGAQLIMDFDLPY